MSFGSVHVFQDLTLVFYHVPYNEVPVVPIACALESGCRLFFLR
jgi:hypothetical protein